MTDTKYIQYLREMADAASSQEERNKILSKIDWYQKIESERKEYYLKIRTDAKELLQGKELVQVLRSIEEMEQHEREETQVKDDPIKLIRLLKERYDHFKNTRHNIASHLQGEERKKALAVRDKHLKQLENRIDELKIYENPPDQKPERSGLRDLFEIKKALKAGTEEEKSELLNKYRRRATEEDAFKKTIQEKLKNPVFRQEIISEYKKRTLNFNILTIMLIVFSIGCCILLRQLQITNDIIMKIYCLAIGLIFTGGYFYLRNKIWRCPVCGCKINIGSRFHGPKNPNSCDRCGAPFR